MVNVIKSDSFSVGLAKFPIPQALSNGKFAVLWSNPLSISIYTSTGILEKYAITTTINNDNGRAYWYIDHVDRSIAAFNNGKFVVTWHGENVASNHKINVKVQFFNNDGTASSGEIAITSGNTYPYGGSWVLALDNNLLSYYVNGQYGTIYGTIIDQENNRIKNNFKLLNNAVNNFDPSASVISDNSFVVVAERVGSSIIDGQRLNFQGEYIGSLITITNSGIQPAVCSVRNKGFIACWQTSDASLQGIKCKIYDQHVNVLVNEFYVNTITYRDQAEVSIANIDSDNFLVTWHSNDQQGDIYATIINFNGVKLIADFKVSDDINTKKIYPFVSYVNGKAFVCYESTNPSVQIDARCTILTITDLFTSSSTATTSTTSSTAASITSTTSDATTTSVVTTAPPTSITTSTAAPITSTSLDSTIASVITTIPPTSTTTFTGVSSSTNAPTNTLTPIPSATYTYNSSSSGNVIQCNLDLSYTVFNAPVTIVENCISESFVQCNINLTRSIINFPLIIEQNCGQINYYIYNSSGKVVVYPHIDETVIYGLDKNTKVDFSLFDCISEALEGTCYVSQNPKVCNVAAVDQVSNGKVEKVSKVVFKELGINFDLTESPFLGNALSKVCESSDSYVYNIKALGMIVSFIMLYEL